MTAIHLTAFLLGLLTAIPSGQGWVPNHLYQSLSTRSFTTLPSSSPHTPSSPLYLYFNDEDSSFAARPLPLSDNDRKRFSAIRDRHLTIPILLLDSMLPGQRLQVGSDDDRFQALAKHLLLTNTTMAMIGFNPTTKKPVNVGVTVSLEGAQQRNNNNNNNNSTMVDGTVSSIDSATTTSITLRAQERIVVHGEPWLDDTGSYHMAHVEVMNDDNEPPLDEEWNHLTEKMYHELPALVEKWFDCLYDSPKSIATPATMKPRLDDIGHDMPEGYRARAFWVGALLNPVPPLGVCFEVRPALLGCTNDYDRVNLAYVALHHSIDHLSGKGPVWGLE